MSIIRLKEANCKNCYKCIRNCPLKAIEFGSEQARILDEDCVLCGRCTLICPQNAKQIRSELPAIQAALKQGQRMMISLAPSYVAAFHGVSFAAMSAALKKLGFWGVEETAIGASQVSKEYTRLLGERKMPNIITTCCPTVIMLIEKYYPELLGHLAPVVSPATAHAKMVRSAYGDEIKVVFAGPCISKKQEADHSDCIESVLMFEELKSWLEEEGISLTEQDNQPAEMHEGISRLYPAPGGIISTIPKSERQHYKMVAIDGLDRCIEILDSIRDNGITGYFLEMSACTGSCVEGPGIAAIRAPFLLSKNALYTNSKKVTDTPMPATENLHIDFSAQYHHTRVRDPIPDEEAIRAILAKQGKTEPSAMLNCGTCGYSTCRDKAIAVYQGKADLRMCLPYMREKAESMSNMIIENTPNAIFVLDHQLNILEYNSSAVSMLDMDDLDYVGLPVEMLVDISDLAQVRDTGAPVIDKRLQSRNGKLAMEQSIVSVPNGDLLLILRDVTGEEASRAELSQLRRDTIQTAQAVIDKQMRVAQEIASLLGETTGETKAALTKLKKSIIQGENL